VRLSFDTNILVYAADIGAGSKHRSSVALMQRALGADCVLCLQSLAEFFHAVTRKGVMSVSESQRLIDEWRTFFPIIWANEECLVEAIEVHRRHRLSFWDAMLWSTARQAGCRILLSEDFQDGLVIGRMRCINPFEAANQALLDAALPAAEEERDGR